MAEMMLDPDARTCAYCRKDLAVNKHGELVHAGTERVVGDGGVNGEHAASRIRILSDSIAVMTARLDARREFGSIAAVLEKPGIGGRGWGFRMSRAAAEKWWPGTTPFVSDETDRLYEEYDRELVAESAEDTSLPEE